MTSLPQPVWSDIRSEVRDGGRGGVHVFFLCPAWPPNHTGSRKTAQLRHRCRSGTLAPYQAGLGRLGWTAQLIDQWTVDFSVDEEKIWTG